MRSSATSTLALGLAATALALAACGGGLTESEGGDGGSRDGGHADSTTLPPTDSGSVLFDAGSSTSSPDGAGGGDTSTGGGSDATTGGGYVDAGYYFGDGSYWLEGGAYPVPDAAADGGGTGAADASTGCGALSTCCATLTGASQELCDTIVGAGNDANCSTEMAQLEAEGDCTGVTILASQIQVPPNRMVSDGTTLFWTTAQGSPGLLAVPVGGGAVTTLLSAPTGGAFLGVDDANVYVLEGSSLVRIPKNGSPATLVNEAGATVFDATLLGGTAYWTEIGKGGDGGVNLPVAVESAPLLGGAVTLIANFSPAQRVGTQIGVTSSTVFLGADSTLVNFPLSGVPAGGPGQVDAGPCGALTSDTDAIYCTPVDPSGTNLRIASDGTSSPLGQALSPSYIVFDDTYVYWVDGTTVGTILKAPKAGGGTASVLARDTSPTAIAVDATSVYWSDQEGYIKSIAK